LVFDEIFDIEAIRVDYFDFKLDNENNIVVCFVSREEQVYVIREKPKGIYNVDMLFEHEDMYSCAVNVDEQNRAVVLFSITDVSNRKEHIVRENNLNDWEEWEILDLKGANAEGGKMPNGDMFFMLATTKGIVLLNFDDEEWSITETNLDSFWFSAGIDQSCGNLQGNTGNKMELFWEEDGIFYTTWIGDAHQVEGSAMKLDPDCNNRHITANISTVLDDDDDSDDKNGAQMGNLVYISMAGGRITVDEEPKGRPAILVDPNGKIYIAYTKWFEDTFNLLVGDPKGEYEIEVLYSEGGGDVEMAVDDNCGIHFVFNGEEGRLIYGHPEVD